MWQNIRVNNCNFCNIFNVYVGKKAIGGSAAAIAATKSFYSLGVLCPSWRSWRFVFLATEFLVQIDDWIYLVYELCFKC